MFTAFASYSGPNSAGKTGNEIPYYAQNLPGGIIPPGPWVAGADQYPTYAEEVDPMDVPYWFAFPGDPSGEFPYGGIQYTSLTQALSEHPDYNIYVFASQNSFMGLMESTGYPFSLDGVTSSGGYFAYFNGASVGGGSVPGGAYDAAWYLANQSGLPLAPGFHIG